MVGGTADTAPVSAASAATRSSIAAIGVPPRLAAITCRRTPPAAASAACARVGRTKARVFVRRRSPWPSVVVAALRLLEAKASAGAITAARAAAEAASACAKLGVSPLAVALHAFQAGQEVFSCDLLFIVQLRISVPALVSDVPPGVLVAPTYTIGSQGM